ncbi:hypothetical protein OF83DRAFT_1064751 [Amylostereum chailletii]|nr:hypothetical protein OF83DRAFT_1064751 [Amylostereum chailletii]
MTAPRPVSIPVPKAPVHPQSSTEHYWAARALTAEALLAASAAHRRELKSVAFSEDIKKQRELAVLRKSHETRQKKMEAIVIASVTCVTVLASLVIYLLFTDERSKQPQSKWAMASHFTIPILSPWTSVVEHETSTFGAKTIVAALVVAACLAYAVFRYWCSYRHRR